MIFAPMSGKPKNKKHFNKLRFKYRLLLINEENLEERFSFRLSRLNVYAILVIISFFWIFLMIYILAFTSIREYIPGYTDPNLEHKIYTLEQNLDSLESKLQTNDYYINNIHKLLSGEEVGLADTNTFQNKRNYGTITNQKSVEDSLLRNELESVGKFNIYYHETEDVYDVRFSKGPKVYFTPINGIITNFFNATKGHYGIDIVAKHNDAIKSIDDGIVIFSEWTINTGYVIAIQHSGNMVSIYKHNSAILKKAGEYVKAGDLISIIGNTGEQSSGPHLHFELWVDGSAVDPLSYISF